MNWITVNTNVSSYTIESLLHDQILHRSPRSDYLQQEIDYLYDYNFTEFEDYHPNYLNAFLNVHDTLAWQFGVAFIEDNDSMGITWSQCVFDETGKGNI